MNTKIIWQGDPSGQFSLLNNNRPLAQLNTQADGKTFIITENGINTHSAHRLSSTTLEMVDPKNRVVLKLYTRKWYSSDFILEYKEKKYEVIARNNPLVEYVIKLDGMEVLAYGIDFRKGQESMGIRISQEKKDVPVLFHALLFILLSPVLKESTSEIFW